MIEYLAGLVAVVLFALILRLMGAIPISVSVLHTSGNAATVIRDSQLSDDDKEQQLQKAAISIFAAFAKLVFISAVALAVPAAMLWGLDQAGLADSGVVMDVMVSWDFLLLATLLSCLVFVRFSKNKSTD